MTSAALYPDPQPILACTVSRDIEEFGLLIEDMEAEMGEHWGDLRFNEVAPFLNQPEAASLRFLSFAIDEDDLDQLELIASAIQTAKHHGVQVILVAEDIPEGHLQQLLREGGEEYLPYPLAKGALQGAIARLDGTAEPLLRLDTTTRVETSPNEDPTAAVAQAVEEAAPEDDDAVTSAEPATSEAPMIAQPTPAEEPVAAEEPARDTPPPQAPPAEVKLGPRSDGAGAVLAVQGLSGGCGASTMAVNLARELAGATKKNPPRVCLLDFDFQFGTTANYLDLAQKASVIELLSDTEAMDDDSFAGALHPAEADLMVLTAPSDLIPLDFVAPEDVARIITLARSRFDYVIIDMQRTITDWTETVLRHCDLFFAVMEIDLRSAQNCVRFRNALLAEGLPVDKLRFVLNRAPKFSDLTGKGRMKRMSESLGVSIELHLPDGGKQITQVADQGESLAKALPKSPLRKAIQKLAADLHQTAHAAQA
ncbi:MAG: pilus assembly protein CpaE [Rhodobacterales bacterium]|nr:MAG: pilus assembly protein CpaE [Rhodobacterales bacterium]